MYLLLQILPYRWEVDESGYSKRSENSWITNARKLKESRGLRSFIWIKCRHAKNTKNSNLDRSRRYNNLSPRASRILLPAGIDELDTGGNERKGTVSPCQLCDLFDLGMSMGVSGKENRILAHKMLGQGEPIRPNTFNGC